MLTNVKEVNLTELAWEGKGCYSHFTGRKSVGQRSWRLYSSSCWKSIVQVEGEHQFPKQRSSKGGTEHWFLKWRFSGNLKCKLHSSKAWARKIPRCLRHHRIMKMCCGTCSLRLWLPLACLKVPGNQQTDTFKHSRVPWGYGEHSLPAQPVLQLQFPGWLHLRNILVRLREDYPWCGPFQWGEKTWAQRIKETGQSCHHTGAKVLNAEFLVCTVGAKQSFLQTILCKWLPL